MEKYSKYRKHTVDTYARELVDAMKAKGDYNPAKHDPFIMSTAMAMKLLQDAQNDIDKNGMMLTTISREGAERHQMNPLANVVAQQQIIIRQNFYKLGLIGVQNGNSNAAVPDSDDGDTDATTGRGDALSELTAIVGGQAKKTYKKVK